MEIFEDECYIVLKAYKYTVLEIFLDYHNIILRVYLLYNTYGILTNSNCRI